MLSISNSVKNRIIGKPQGLMLLILLLALFLRSYQLDAQALRGDEAATVLYAALPLSELWELSRITDPHPPLYYALLHPWQQLFGSAAWMMRLAGVAASTLAVAVLYRLARRSLGSAAVGLLAAGLLAINPLQIWLAQDVRSYPIFTLLGLLSSWALWLALTTQQPAPKSWIRRPAARVFFRWLIYVGLTVACLYVHYYTIFLIAFQGLFVLLNARTFRDKTWPWLASQAAIGLLIIPGLQLAYNFIGQAAGGINKIPTLDILRLTSTALISGFTLADGWGLAISLLLLPVWLIGLGRLLHRDWLAGSFWTLFFAVPVAGVIALSIDRPFFKERFLVQAQPAFQLMLAVGLLAIWQAKDKPWPNKPGQIAPRVVTPLLLAALLYVNFLTLGNYFGNPAFAKAPPWQLYHNYVQDKYKQGDVMLTNFPEAAVSYYSPQGVPFYVVPAERDRPAAFRLAQTEQIAGAYNRIWFLPLLRQGFDEPGDVLNWLDRHADRVDQTFFPAYHLNLYLSPPTIERLMIAQPVAFGHDIALRGFQVFDKNGKSRLAPAGDSGSEQVLTMEPDESFNLSLYWQAAGPTDSPHTVFVHLIAADGFNRTSRDNQPVWGSYPTTDWSPTEQVTDKYSLTIPPGTPPGDHRLRLGWYQSETQTRVPVLDGSGQPGSDYVILNLTVRVEAQ